MFFFFLSNFHLLFFFSAMSSLCCLLPFICFAFTFVSFVFCPTSTHTLSFQHSILYCVYFFYWNSRTLKAKKNIIVIMMTSVARITKSVELAFQENRGKRVKGVLKLNWRYRENEYKLKMIFMFSTYCKKKKKKKETMSNALNIKWISIQYTVLKSKIMLIIMIITMIWRMRSTT